MIRTGGREMDDKVVEQIGKAIAEADSEDYMEDWRRYDARARAAIRAYEAAMRAAGFLILAADDH